MDLRRAEDLYKNRHMQHQPAGRRQNGRCRRPGRPQQAQLQVVDDRVPRNQLAAAAAAAAAAATGV